MANEKTVLSNVTISFWPTEGRLWGASAQYGKSQCIGGGEGTSADVAIQRAVKAMALSYLTHQGPMEPEPAEAAFKAGDRYQVMSGKHHVGDYCTPVHEKWFVTYDDGMEGPEKTEYLRKADAKIKRIK